MNQTPVVLVTGAARGIGREIALQFARCGYAVSGIDVLDAELERVAAGIRDLGQRVLPQSGDLADLDFAESAVRRTVEQLGRLDVLVNNAAWRELTSLREITLDSWERTLRIGLTVPAFLARWAAEDMRRRQRGVIINISSIIAHRGSGTSPAYATAKGGLDALTYELAATYGRDGIRAVGIRPGAIDTAGSQDYFDAHGVSLTDELRAWSEDAIPLGRWGTAEELARMVVLLAADEASYLTGVNLTVDGGWSHNHFPRHLLDRMQRGDSPRRHGGHREGEQH
jgi:3-oxoacyl-[acyl-carrier protein] reductase